MLPLNKAFLDQLARNQVRAQVLTPVEDRISDQISIRDEGRVIRTLCEDRIWETVKGSLEKYDGS